MATREVKGFVVPHWAAAVKVGAPSSAIETFMRIVKIIVALLKLRGKPDQNVALVAEAAVHEAHAGKHCRKNHRMLRTYRKSAYVW